MNDDEPLLIILGDTLFEADLTSIVANPDNVLVTKKVADGCRASVVGKKGSFLLGSDSQG